MVISQITPDVASSMNIEEIRKKYCAGGRNSISEEEYEALRDYDRAEDAQEKNR